MSRFVFLSLFFSALLASGCTTMNVDHIRLSDSVDYSSGDAVVVLGRRHTAHVETEATLVKCLGQKLKGRVKDLRLVSENEFVDQFYPWFESRTAPQHPNKLKTLLAQPHLAEKVDQLGLRFIVWVSGSTERTNQRGSMSCSVGPGGGGCFGFGTWEDTSDYETSIWDAQELREIGRISTDAVGTSYMPAFVVPIPMLAFVESDACNGMGRQLVSFFQSQGSQIKQLQ